MNRPPFGSEEYVEAHMRKFPAAPLKSSKELAMSEPPQQPVAAPPQPNEISLEDLAGKLSGATSHDEVKAASQHIQIIVARAEELVRKRDAEIAELRRPIFVLIEKISALEVAVKNVEGVRAHYQEEACEFDRLIAAFFETASLKEGHGSVLGFFEDANFRAERNAAAIVARADKWISSCRGRIGDLRNEVKQYAVQHGLSEELQKGAEAHGITLDSVS